MRSSFFAATCFVVLGLMTGLIQAARIGFWLSSVELSFRFGQQKLNIGTGE